MIIVGSRAHYAKTLADYLLSKDGNDAVFIRAIENYPSQQLSQQNLTNALQLMETQSLAKGKERTLYHAVLALPRGESLNREQLKMAIDHLAANLKLTGHQRLVVEHRKGGRQHFHIIFNMLDPLTGKLARLPLDIPMLHRTAAQLEGQFGLRSQLRKGRSIRHWEHQRGKRSGIDPLKMRKMVTGIFNSSRNGAEFIKLLSLAGYALTIGKFNSYVIVDKVGHIHGLMGRIEGAKSADLHARFPDLKRILLPSMAQVQSQRAKASKAPPIKKTSVQSKMAQPPAPSLPSRRMNRVAQLMAYAQLSAETEKAKILKAAAFPLIGTPRHKGDVNEPPKANFNRADIDRAELIAWAFENGRFDILAQFGIHVAPDVLEAQQEP